MCNGFFFGSLGIPVWLSNGSSEWRKYWLYIFILSTVFSFYVIFGTSIIQRLLLLSHRYLMFSSFFFYFCCFGCLMLLLLEHYDAFLYFCQWFTCCLLVRLMLVFLVLFCCLVLRYVGYLCCMLFGDHSICCQGLLLAVCFRIIAGSAQGIMCSAKDWTWVSHLPYLSSTYIMICFVRGPHMPILRS